MLAFRADKLGPVELIGWPEQSNKGDQERMATRSPAGANQPDIDTWIVESNRATVFKSLVAAPTQHRG